MGIRDENPAAIDSRVGQRIALRRATLGLSQQHLAERLGIPVNAVKAFESGFSRPTGGQIVELCQILEITPSWLFADNSVGDRLT